MSWDSYLDNLVAQTRDSSGTAHCDQAVIMGLDGGGLWTTNTSPKALRIQPAEAQTIAGIMKSGNSSHFMTRGAVIAGQKYTFLRDDGMKLVYLKAKGHGAICIAKSKTAVVIGHCPEGMQAGQLNKGVIAIAEYLESMGM